MWTGWNGSHGSSATPGSSPLVRLPCGLRSSLDGNALAFVQAVVKVPITVHGSDVSDPTFSFARQLVDNLPEYERELADLVAEIRMVEGAVEAMPKEAARKCLQMRYLQRPAEMWEIREALMVDDRKGREIHRRALEALAEIME